jgi:hypothetical protein
MITPVSSTILIDDVHRPQRLIDIIDVARCRLCSAHNDNIIITPVVATTNFGD